MFRARNALRWGGVTTVSDAAGVPPAGDSGAEEGRDGPDPGVRAEPGVREELDVDAREEPDTREEPDASEEPSLGERALARSRAAARAAPGVAWTLTKGTAVGAFRYRVTGLAAGRRSSRCCPCRPSSSG